MKFVLVILAITVGWILFTPQKTELLTTHNLPAGRQDPQPSLTPAPTKAPIRTIKNTVPFIPQAPFGNWDDLRQQEACEESSALMAMRWVHGIESIDRDDGLEEILAISGYQETNFGLYHDTSAADTITRIFKDYYNYYNVELKNDVSLPEVISEVLAGHLVIAPTNGQALFNPNYTPPGPERHMLVITGYDADTHEFITNDPGTRVGHNYRYDELVFWRAIRDYPTGYNLPITTSPKNIIVIKK